MLLTTGDVFMPAATWFDEPYLNSASMLTASRLLCLRAEVAREEFMAGSQFTAKVARVLAGQFRLSLRHMFAP